MYLTQRFARFIAETDYSALPEQVIYSAKERVMDTIGAAIAGSCNWEYSAALRAACRGLGGGNTPVIGGGGETFPAARAAMINATYAHAVELDDGHRNAGCHAGAVIVPTALALGGSGKDMLTAVAIGYEVTYRLASHVNPAQINKGFHPSSNCGVYGAMAVAGKRFGLSAEQLANGLGQAGMLAGGTMEATVSGQRSKCVQVGNAAFNGISAACFAREGMEGCLSALEGRYGLFSTQSENVDVEDVCRDLGKVYTIGDTYNKMYPSCRHAQPGIEGVLDLVAEHGLRPEDVAGIHIGTHQVALNLTGTIKAPKNSGEAKFSLAYGAAAALRDRAFGIAHLTEPYYTDPELLALAQNVTCGIDPEVQAAFPERRGAKVEIVCRDGRRFEKTLYDLRGSSRKPVGWAELQDKFIANARPNFSDERLEQILRLLKELEQVEDVGILAGLLAFA